MLTIAGIQMACGPEVKVNFGKALDLARIAIERGAKIVCFAECFAWPWFPRKADESQRALPLRSDQLRGRNRPESGQDLSLYRVSDPHRHRLSYHGAELAGHFRSKERNTEDLHQDR